MENKSLIVITGASSGIGKAVAIAFAKLGYPLLLLSRRLDEMQKLNLPNAICEAVDVTNYEALRDAINRAEEVYGPVCGLINNAGILANGDFMEIPQAQDQAMSDINFMGVINGIKAVLPTMQKQKAGTIINVSSLGDRAIAPTSATYCATKAAVKSLTESLRQGNFEFNIRFCNLAPALVDTPIWGGKENKWYQEMVVSNSLIKAEELADIIIWIYQQPKHINIRDLVITPTQSPI